MLIRRQTRSDNRRRGAVLVEMALVLPIFLAVVLGIIEFGRAMMVSQMVTNAAREGTRMAIIDDETNSTVTNWIQGFLADAAGVSAGDIIVNITVDNPAAGNQVGNAEPRDLVTIVVSVPFDKVQYVSGKFLNGKNLTARSAMRHE